MKEKNEIINNTRKRLNMISGDFQNGNKFCDAIEEIIDYVEYCKEEKETLWDETKRLANPHRVYVDLSQKLYDEKQRLLNQMSVAK